MWKWCGARHGLYYLIEHDDGRKIYLALDDYATELLKILNAYEHGNSPELDGTGFEHPAFARGQDDGVRGACRVLTKVLDGDPVGTFSEPLRTIVDRVQKLINQEA